MLCRQTGLADDRCASCSRQVKMSMVRRTGFPDAVLSHYSSATWYECRITSKLRQVCLPGTH